MFIAAASASRARFESTSSCSTNARQELTAGLPLSRAHQHGAADLVEHGRRTLLAGRIDDLRLQRVDRRQFLLASVQPELIRCR